MSDFEDKYKGRVSTDAGDLAPPQRPGYATGHAYVDHGVAASDADLRLLTGDQRARVVDLIHGRVIDARGSFLAACTQLRVDELLAKDDHSAMFEAILEAVGGVALLGLNRMFAAVKSAGERVVEEAQLDYRTASAASHAIASMDARSANGVAKSVVSAVKRRAASPAPAATDGVALVDMLADQSGPAFEAVRELAPVTMTDRQLLAMLDAFRAANQTVSEYREVIGGKIERYKRTQIGDVGAHRHGKFVHEQWKYGGTEMDTRLVGPRDTKVFVVLVMGERRYAICRCELAPPNAYGESSPFPFAGNDDHFAAPMAYPAVGLHGRPISDRDYRFVQWVTPEFEDVAIRQNIAAWGATPTVRTDIIPWGRP